MAGATDMTSLHTVSDWRETTQTSRKFTMFYLGNTSGAEGGLVHGRSRSAVCVCSCDTAQPDLISVAVCPKGLATRARLFFAGYRTQTVAGLSLIGTKGRAAIPAGLAASLATLRDGEGELAFEASGHRAVAWLNQGHAPWAYSTPLSAFVDAIKGL